MLDDQLANTIIKAARDALAQWRTVAKFQGISINGPVAVGGPGCLVGPRLDTAMLAALARFQGEDKAIADQASRGIGDAFDRWRQQLTVPGLAWYPLFAYYPGPMTPPTANVPCRLIELPSSGMADLTNAVLLERAMTTLGGPTSPRKSATFRQVASQLASDFMAFITQTSVLHVMGQGPVPGYAGPMTGPSPVVGGSVIGMTGMLV